ncbi:hypothetical protein FJ692_17750 [Pseudomonas fluorescens]|uniref:Uncharacterized protein n=1 Tax=Pseudomonas fluorescens TaxID=294 RepID=A0A2T0HR99_PSEFL|nr:hypothetical protein C7A10_26810 [Pseudomonas fluorescens]TPV55572.1 hypothetical protein FJ692_17750 [Pseudomonas fluorescens]
MEPAHRPGIETRADAGGFRAALIPRGELACVGAGLPAMQAPRSISQTAVMLSQASQLPHLTFTPSNSLQSAKWPSRQPFSNRNKLLLYRS